MNYPQNGRGQGHMTYPIFKFYAPLNISGERVIGKGWLDILNFRWQIHHGECW